MGPIKEGGPLLKGTATDFYEGILLIKLPGVVDCGQEDIGGHL